MSKKIKVRPVRPRTCNSKNMKDQYEIAASQTLNQIARVKTISKDTQSLLALDRALGSKTVYFANHALGFNNHKRPDITGYQRSTIYFSSLQISELARSHNCSIKTIRNIQRDPLAACGITSHQFQSLKSDLIDIHKASFYTKVSSINKLLPVLPKTFRLGPKSQKYTDYLLFEEKYVFILNSDTKVYENKIL